MPALKKKSTFKYRPHMSVGSMSAEEDQKFLNDGFIETDDYAVLRDFESPKSILLGRTGAGKSAIISHIKASSPNNAISIDPQSLALNYLSNSNVLRFWAKQGVRLDIFYRLLWQHVFCVELLNYHFKLKSEDEFTRLKDWVAGIVRKDPSKKAGIDYLQKWNGKFWLEREERIKEITKNLENNLEASVGTNIAALKADYKENKIVSSEVIERAQKIVNEIQIQHLSQVIDLIADDLFDDPQRKIFITIDALDNDWVEDELRYKLIRALIETVKKFRRIRSVKIIVALRNDLLERVYETTRDPGFQAEKYEDLYARINWTRAQLKELIDKRIGLLFKDTYTNKKAEWSDIFPSTVRAGQDTFDYIVKRTLMRPRDAIAFVNAILEKAQGTEVITARTVLETERVHSERRVNALLDEWVALYPKLSRYIEVLKNKPTSFAYSNVEEKDLDDLILSLISDADETDPIENIARKTFENKSDYTFLKKELFNALFKVGFIGYKAQSSYPYTYSYSGSTTSFQFNPETKIQIHPMFWAYFNSQKIRGVLTEEDAD